VQPPLAPGQRTWTGLTIVLALGAILAWPAPREALDWQPQLALAQPWRLWTAAFVHWSPMHLQANLLGCVAVAAFGVAARLPRHATWSWLAAWPLTQAMLALQPLLLHYGGLSGVLHAGAAVAALDLVLRAGWRRRMIGWAVLGGLAAKLALERPWAGPTQIVPGWDIAIAPLVHLTGTVAGLLCGAVALALARPRSAARI
jgi:rhomboid family GlyGly-CTERM serine protease